jgi:hypothetical protein
LMKWLCHTEVDLQGDDDLPVLQLHQGVSIGPPPAPAMATQHIESTSTVSPQEGCSASDVSVWFCALRAGVGWSADVVNSVKTGRRGEVRGISERWAGSGYEHRRNGKTVSRSQPTVMRATPIGVDKHKRLPVESPGPPASLGCEGREEVKLWPTGTPGSWVSLRTQWRQECRREASQRLGQCLASGRREGMRGEVVEGDRPGGSASASPAGKSTRLTKKGSLPKARPVPRQWEGRMMSCYPSDARGSQKGTSWKARPVPHQPKKDDRVAVLKRGAGVGCRRPARNSN